MRRIAGAYPAAPPDLADRASQLDFLSRLAASPHVEGLELPYVDAASAEQRWLPEAWPAHWANVVTAVPATVMHGGADPRFGLASRHEAGRRAALDLTRAVRDAVDSLAQRLGRAAVLAVEVHSAPAGEARGSQLARSLAEIGDWDWSGARLAVEHCDAATGSHQPEKGYLPIDAEIAAAADAAVGVGLVVNWGRSVIEARHADGAPAHVAAATDAALLTGVMFSGVAAEPVGAFPAWADAHLPPRMFEPGSLLDTGEMRRTLAAAGSHLPGLEFVGAKTAARQADGTVAERAATVTATMALVAEAYEALAASTDQHIS